MCVRGGVEVNPDKFVQYIKIGISWESLKIQEMQAELSPGRSQNSNNTCSSPSNES